MFLKSNILIYLLRLIYLLKKSFILILYIITALFHLYYRWSYPDSIPNRKSAMLIRCCYDSDLCGNDAGRFGMLSGYPDHLQLLVFCMQAFLLYCIHLPLQIQKEHQHEDTLNQVADREIIQDQESDIVF